MRLRRQPRLPLDSPVETDHRSAVAVVTLADDAAAAAEVPRGRVPVLRSADFDGKEGILIPGPRRKVRIALGFFMAV